MEYSLDSKYWINFYIYSDINHIFLHNNNPILFKRWYYDKVKNLIGKILEIFKNEIEILFFTEYIENKPNDPVSKSNFNIEKYKHEIAENQNRLREYLRDQPLVTRFIRWRLLLKKSEYKKLELIIQRIIDEIQDFEDIFAYELVNYDLSGDIGNRYCRTTETWNPNNDIEMKRLELFLKYWDAISRYTIKIITQDLKLDSEHVDTMGILHLGYNTLGTYIFG